jgi:hypothetical protein
MLDWVVSLAVLDPVAMSFSRPGSDVASASML